LSEPLTIVIAAGLPAAAAFAGAGVAAVSRPATLLLSIAFGLAGGVVIGTVALEMIPRAEDLDSPLTVVIGFAVGFAAVYVLDLFFNRWRVAGHRAAEHRKVVAFHRRKHPRGEQALVLAWGTTAEEIIEGIVIGVGISVSGELGFLIALAIGIDNLTEAFSIGALLREEADASGHGQLHLARRILTWSSAPGVALFVSALIGWAALRDLSDAVLATMLAIGAGSLFYLVVTDFIPEAEERQYQQSAAVAAALGFVAIYAISTSM